MSDPESTLKKQLEELRSSIRNTEVCTCQPVHAYFAGFWHKFEPSTTQEECKVCNPENNNE